MREIASHDNPMLDFSVLSCYIIGVYGAIARLDFFFIHDRDVRKNHSFGPGHCRPAQSVG